MDYEHIKNFKFILNHYASILSYTIRIDSSLIFSIKIVGKHRINDSSSQRSLVTLFYSLNLVHGISNHTVIYSLSINPIHAQCFAHQSSRSWLDQRIG